MSTRRAVARAAGVSVRTVSNVVNDFEHVAPATRVRVLEAIERLGYRPSEVARTLKVGRSGLLALMLPELDTPYFAELTRAVVDEGYSRGLTVVVDQTDGDIERERSFVSRSARGGLFDALLLSPLALDSVDIARVAADAPVVLMGEVPFPGFDKVMIDNAGAARAAVAHLIAGGARRIAAIGEISGDRGSAVQRLAGYRQALADAGISADPALVAGIPTFSRANGAAAMHALLDLPEPPDAVFAFSDPIGHGALRTLHERGVRVPRDLALIGFDDNEESRFSSPTLSTISPDLAWIARTALDRVVARLDGSELPPETLLGPWTLIARESSGAHQATITRPAR